MRAPLSHPVRVFKLETAENCLGVFDSVPKSLQRGATKRRLSVNVGGGPRRANLQCG